MRYLLAAFLFLQSIIVIGQKINDAGSWEQALKKAAKEDRPIFVQFESATCNECNEVADLGIGYEGARAAIAKDFVFIKISPDHPDRAQIGADYNIANGFGALFVHHSGTIIHKYTGSSSSKTAYESQMQMALSKAKDVGKNSALAEAYKSGNRDIDFMEQYLLYRQTLELSTDSLLEEYAHLLPPDSLKSIRTLEFIARMVPALGSKADMELRKDLELFNQAWYRIDLPVRVNINGNIINKTMRKAVEEKNTGLAMRTAAFSRNINSNPEAGERSYKRTLMSYYRQVKDTTAYFESAVAFYTRYYMNISIDSVKQSDSISRNRQLQQAALRDTVKDGRPVQVRAITFAPNTQRYTNELNEAAWNFYTMTDNVYLLSIAASWVERGLQFYESPEALHTYASLLYKLGQPQKAINSLQRSIAIRKERHYPTNEYEAVLQRMESGAPLTK